MVILIGSFTVEFWGFSRFHMGILIKHILIKSSNYSKMRLLYRIQDIRMLLPKSLFQNAKPDGKGENTVFTWQIQSLGFQRTHTLTGVLDHIVERFNYTLRAYAHTDTCEHSTCWTFWQYFFAYLHVLYFKQGTFFGNQNEIKTISSEFQFSWNAKQTKAKFTLVRTWNYSYLYSDIKIITSSSATPKHPHISKQSQATINA